MKLLTVKTWCLPAGLSQEKLALLHNTIVVAVVSISSTEVKSEDDMLNLFPSDLMEYGLGKEIKIEVTDIPHQMNLSDRKTLAIVIGKAVSNLFPEANIFCKVSKHEPKEGTWSSVK